MTGFALVFEDRHAAILQRFRHREGGRNSMSGKIIPSANRSARDAAGTATVNTPAEKLPLDVSGVAAPDDRFRIRRRSGQGRVCFREAYCRELPGTASFHPDSDGRTLQQEDRRQQRFSPERRKEPPR